MAGHQLLRRLSGLDGQHHRQQPRGPQGQGRVGGEQGPLDARRALGVGGDDRQGMVLGGQAAVNVQGGDNLQPRLPGDGAEVHGAGEGIAVDKGLFAAVGLLGRPQQGGDGGHLFLHGGDLKGGLLVGVR